MSEGGREGGREGRREGGKEGGREGGREEELMQCHKSKVTLSLFLS